MSTQSHRQWAPGESRYTNKAGHPLIPKEALVSRAPDNGSVSTRYLALIISRNHLQSDVYTNESSLIAQCNVGASLNNGGVTASTGLLVAERHAGVWTPVIAHKTISAEPQFALAA